MRKKSIWLVISLVLISAFVFTACQPAPAEEAPMAEEAEEAEEVMEEEAKQKKLRKRKQQPKVACRFLMQKRACSMLPS